ncbi:OprD family outer membrane porin [Acinetobacter pittii]|nr:OprD family outer membrane porin [Acinetobacter pittii]MCU4328209.1 OprD family porin [Acinetobacter pittii]OCZ20094.1 porin [Acinetobacter pittii]
MNKLIYIAPCLLVMAAKGNVVFAKDINVDLTLKNLYADRNYNDDNKPSIGSWSQGIIARASAKQNLAQDTNLLITGSLQYAQRLSSDNHLTDLILPFDKESQKQASSYNKIAGSIGLQHKQHKLSWGEQWVDTPLATTDYSRQLMTIYQGFLYSGQINKDLNIDIGHLNRYSVRNEEKFKKLSVKNHESDGLTYIDLKHKSFQGKLDTQLFVSELEDLYDQYSLGLNLKQDFDKFRLKTKFRYYYTEEAGRQLLGKIDNQYFGLMQEIGYGPNTFGIGIQKIQGNTDFPMLDGAVPVLSYINWTQGTFNKANEISYHFTFNHDAGWLMPGLNFLLRYVDGKNYLINNEKGFDESEFDFIMNYKIKEGKFKGLGLQWLNLNYKNDIGGDYMENRIITSYTVNF